MANHSAENAEKKPWHKSELEKDGFTWGSAECNREKWKRMRQDGELRRRTLQRRRRYDQSEESKRRDRERKARARSKNPEGINAVQRDWYARNRHDALESIRKRRYANDPTRGIHTLINRCLAGEIGVDELTRRVSAAVDGVNERINSQQAGPCSPDDLSRDGQGSGHTRKGNHGNHEAKT